MRRENRRYSGYRGRATTTDKLRVVAVVLFALVLLAFVGLLIGQRYIVYTDDGLRLELPFLDREEQVELPQEPEDIKVVVEPAQSEEEQPEDLPVEEAKHWTKAVSLPLEAVRQGTAAEQARQMGANAIVLDMKTDLGQLGYVSDLALAEQVSANYGDQAINGALGELSGRGYYLVARISCFRDHALAEELTYAIETNPGRRWFDLSSVRWSSPASSAVQDYLIGVMTELARLGFDEILLDNWGYPTQADGHLEYIKKGDAYQVGALDETIGAFLQKAQEALADSGAILSVRTDETVLAGSNSESGQTLEQLVQMSGRIWLEESVDRLQAEQQLEQSGVENAFEHLVVTVDLLNEESQEHQVLSGE